ncbi:MAG: DUF2946 family protein [Betaproteobacteria bacterium]|nr:DUF2946 family protein [Betaproteobacteria bacterium]MDH5352709.1 DUF2946 family protein [Betaproteobacteria bacterium]
MNRRSFPALLAIVAVALQAAWPLIAQARPQDRGHLVPLCSVGAETRYVEIPAGKLPAEQRSAAYREHCQLCVLGAEGLAAVPPAPLPPLRVVLAALLVDGRDRATPIAVHVDSPADARAPPARS